MSIREEEEFKHLIEDGKLRIGSEHTVEIEFREPLDFEEQLLLTLTDPDRGNSGASAAVKGRWIHGWLQEKGRDYINNLHKNWLFFTEYVRVRTEQFINTSQYSLRQGKYESTYRYILILEELGVLERFTTESVPQEEYDHFVPDNMRARTFVRILEGIDENPEAWLRPHNTLFPDGEKDEDASLFDKPTEDVEPEQESTVDDLPEVEGDIEDVEDVEGDGTTVDDLPDIDGEGEDTEAEDVEDIEVDGAQIPSEVEQNDGISIAEVEERDTFTRILVNDYFGEAVRKSFEESDITPPDTEPEDYSFGRTAVFGVWAEGKAEEGQSINVLVSIDGSDASTNLSFVPPATRMHLQQLMNNDPRVADIFESVNIAVSFDEAFRQQVNDLVRGEQSLQYYYDLIDDEFKSV